MTRHIFALIGLVVVCVLFGIAVHYHLGGLSFNPEVKPIETATLVIAIYIVISLQELFATKASNTRIEKDIVIEEFRDSLVQLRMCRDALVSCQDSPKIGTKQKAALLSHLRRLANALDSAENTLKLSYCKRLATDQKPLTNAYLEFKKSATGYSFPTQGYSKDQISDQTKAHRELHSQIQRLIFTINQFT